MALPLAAGLFLTETGLVALCFGPYALLRGGRSQRSGIGPLSERGVHPLAGIRMTRDRRGEPRPWSLRVVVVFLGRQVSGLSLLPSER